MLSGNGAPYVHCQVLSKSENLSMTETIFYISYLSFTAIHVTLSMDMKVVLLTFRLYLSLFLKYSESLHVTSNMMKLALHKELSQS